MQIEALKAAGVDEVVLAINYQPEVLFHIGVIFLFGSILSVLIKSARSSVRLQCFFSQ